MRIYVAGPLTAATPYATLENIAQAELVGIRLMYRGHQPYLPHLCHYWSTDVEQGKLVPLPYERWMELCLAWVEVSEALFFMDSSPGADTELAYAEKLGLPIFRTLEEVPDVH